MNNTPSIVKMGFSKVFFYFFCIALVSVSISFQSCDPTNGMTPQDAESLESFNILKIDAISIMKKGAKSYAAMAPQIKEYKVKMDDQLTYERAKDKNLKTVQMLELISNPDGNLLGGFFKRWENEDKLNGPFIKEIAKGVSESFDKIINLEKRKKKS